MEDRCLWTTEMPPTFQPFSQVSPRQRGRILSNVMDTFEKHCPSLTDATAFFQMLLEKCQTMIPGLCLGAAGTSNQVLESLGGLRASVEDKYREGLVLKPCISVDDLDRVAVGLPLTREELSDVGYPLTQARYAKARKPLASTASSSTNTGGRPSKVKNAELKELVSKTLQAYLKESERIVIIGRGNSKRMVLAKHLSKRKHVIYKSEPDLHNAMSWSTLHRILKLHFPYVRNPRRLTDICALACC